MSAEPTPRPVTWALLACCAKRSGDARLAAAYLRELAAWAKDEGSGEEGHA